jgi:hypothetical protein
VINLVERFYVTSWGFVTRRKIQDCGDGTYRQIPFINPQPKYTPFGSSYFDTEEAAWEHLFEWRRMDVDKSKKELARAEKALANARARFAQRNAGQ